MRNCRIIQVRAAAPFPMCGSRNSLYNSIDKPGNPGASYKQTLMRWGSAEVVSSHKRCL